MTDQPQAPLKLYKLEFRHYSPKDSEHGYSGMVITRNERDLTTLADTQGVWVDRMDEPVIYFPNDDWSEDGEEITFLEALMRNRGDWFEDPQDLHYGYTHYGWSEGIEIDEDLAAKLVELGLVSHCVT